MKKLRMLLHKNTMLSAALLFLPFMYAQLVILRAGNAAGRGFLPDDRQAWVYCFLQLPVIAGFLLHAGLSPRLRSKKAYAALSAGALGLCAAGAFTLLFASPASPIYLILTGITVFLLGWVCGAVYVKLSALTESASAAGFGVAAGYAAAVALQFVTQLQWTVLPAAAVLLALCFALLAVFFTEPEPLADDAPAPEKPPAPRRRLLCTAAITMAFLLFTAYYTGYIHHLQVASGYGEYNVYTWPRLMLIPVVLAFGWLGSVKEGKLLPVGTLCVVVTAFLNTALIGRETYLLNMCLYYIALGAVVAYYHLAFLRLAPRTKNPALWAGMGRLIDSAAVVFSFGVRFSDLPRAAVLAVDIALLGLVIVLMTLNRDFALDAPAAVSADAPAPAPEPAKADPFPLLQARYGITPAEMNVLRELVLTDDKQEAIAARLNISVSTMRHHITSIYKKTDVQSRAGLCRLAAADEFQTAAAQ